MFILNLEFDSSMQLYVDLRRVDECSNQQIIQVTWRSVSASVGTALYFWRIPSFFSARYLHLDAEAVGWSSRAGKFAEETVIRQRDRVGTRRCTCSRRRWRIGPCLCCLLRARIR